MVNPRYRVYAHANDQFQFLDGVDYSQSEDEILQGQVALLYAQADKDAHGQFHPTFVATPDDIREFKRRTNHKVKFFVSMGGQPFPLTEEDVPNAVRSLAKIIIDYDLDGIDVYYESIPVDAAQFVQVMEKVIKKLKDKKSDLEVSITVPPLLDDQYYRPLYVRVLNLIDYVIYLAYLAADLVPTVKQLVEMYRVLPYPTGKLFAGHSIKPRDRTYFPLPVFREATRVLLNKGLISGTADGVVICDDKPKA